MATAAQIAKAKEDIANWKPPPPPTPPPPPEPTPVIRMPAAEPSSPKLTVVPSPPRGASMRTLEAMNAGLDTQKALKVINDLLEATTFVLQKKTPDDPSDAPRLVLQEVPDHPMRREGARLQMEWTKLYLDRDLGKLIEQKQILVGSVLTPEQKAKNLFSSPAAMSVIGDDVKLLIEALKETPEGRKLLEESIKVTSESE